FANAYVYQFGNHPGHRAITKEVMKDARAITDEMDREIQRRIDLAEAEYKSSNDSLRLLAMITVAVALSVVVLLLFWIVTRSSTAKLLETSGARPGGSTTSEDRVKKILATLAQRAGVPEPGLYVIDTPVPNSFAMGMRPTESSVVVTEGLMKLLDDRELEAV